MNPKRLLVYSGAGIVALALVCTLVWGDVLRLNYAIYKIRAAQEPQAFGLGGTPGLNYSDEELLVILGQENPDAILRQIERLRTGDAKDELTAAALAFDVVPRLKNPKVITVIDHYLNDVRWPYVLVGSEILIRAREISPEFFTDPDERKRRDQLIHDAREDFKSNAEAVVYVFDLALAVEKSDEL